MKRPAAHPTRVLLAAALDLAVLGSTVALGTAADAVTGSEPVGDLARWAVPGLVVAWLGPKVSYRRRDALFGFFFFWIVVWRATYLPYRDWPPRDDEVPQARYLRAEEFGPEWKPDHAGVWRLPQDSSP